MSCHSTHRPLSALGENEGFQSRPGQPQVVKTQGSSDVNTWGKKSQIMQDLIAKDNQLPILKGIVNCLSPE